MKKMWIAAGAVALIGLYAALHVDAGQLDPPGPVSPSMHGLEQIGGIADQTLRVFDDQLGGAVDPRAEAYLYIEIDGAAVLGEVVGGPYHDMTRVISLVYEVDRPFDPLTGVPTGRHLHKVFVLRLNVGRGWPEVYKAADLNLPVNEATVFWTRPDVGQYYKIKLTDAKVTEATLKTVPTPAGQAHILEVHLIFQVIEVTSEATGYNVIDNWAGS